MIIFKIKQNHRFAKLIKAVLYVLAVSMAPMIGTYSPSSRVSGESGPTVTGEQVPTGLEYATTVLNAWNEKKPEGIQAQLDRIKAVYCDTKWDSPDIGTGMGRIRLGIWHMSALLMTESIAAPDPAGSPQRFFLESDLTEHLLTNYSQILEDAFEGNSECKTDISWSEPELAKEIKRLYKDIKDGIQSEPALWFWYYLIRKGYILNDDEHNNRLDNEVSKLLNGLGHNDGWLEMSIQCFNEFKSCIYNANNDYDVPDWHPPKLLYVILSACLSTAEVLNITKEEFEAMKYQCSAFIREWNLDISHTDDDGGDVTSNLSDTRRANKIDELIRNVISIAVKDSGVRDAKQPSDKSIQSLMSEISQNMTGHSGMSLHSGSGNPFSPASRDLLSWPESPVGFVSSGGVSPVARRPLSRVPEEGRDKTPRGSEHGTLDLSGATDENRYVFLQGSTGPNTAPMTSAGSTVGLLCGQFGNMDAGDQGQSGASSVLTARAAQKSLYAYQATGSAFDNVINALGQSTEQTPVAIGPASTGVIPAYQETESEEGSPDQPQLDPEIDTSEPNSNSDSFQAFSDRSSGNGSSAVKADESPEVRLPRSATPSPEVPNMGITAPNDGNSRGDDDDTASLIKSHTSEPVDLGVGDFEAWALPGPVEATCSAETLTVDDDLRGRHATDGSMEVERRVEQSQSSSNQSMGSATMSAPTEGSTDQVPQSPTEAAGMALANRPAASTSFPEVAGGSGAQPEKAVPPPPQAHHRTHHHRNRFATVPTCGDPERCTHHSPTNEPVVSHSSQSTTPPQGAVIQEGTAPEFAPSKLPATAMYSATTVKEPRSGATSVNKDPEIGGVSSQIRGQSAIEATEVPITERPDTPSTGADSRPITPGSIPGSGVGSSSDPIQPMVHPQEERPDTPSVGDLHSLPTTPRSMPGRAGAGIVSSAHSLASLGDPAAGIVPTPTDDSLVSLGNRAAGYASTEGSLNDDVFRRAPGLGFAGGVQGQAYFPDMVGAGFNPFEAFNFFNIPGNVLGAGPSDDGAEPGTSSAADPAPVGELQFPAYRPILNPPSAFGEPRPFGGMYHGGDDQDLMRPRDQGADPAGIPQDFDRREVYEDDLYGPPLDRDLPNQFGQPRHIPQIAADIPIGARPPSGLITGMAALTQTPNGAVSLKARIAMEAAQVAAQRFGVAVTQGSVPKLAIRNGDEDISVFEFIRRLYLPKKLSTTDQIVRSLEFARWAFDAFTRIISKLR